MSAKRQATLAAALALLTVLTAGCSSGSGAAGAGGSAGGKRYKIVYVQGMAGNPFFTSLTCGAQAEAAARGASFDAQGGKDYSPQSQTPVLNAVIAQHPDAILISPMAGQAMVPPLTQAKAQGIKLVFADSKAADDSLAVSEIASDNYAGGVLAAKTLATEVGDKGKVVVMGAKPGISTTDARQQGFTDEMKNHPAITVLPPQYSESAPATATSKLSAVLAADSDLTGVFAVSTQEVEGVATGVQNAGAAGRVKVVGFDSSAPILDDVRNGVVQDLVLQEPLQIGKEAVDQALDALEGKPTTKSVATPYVVLNKANMDAPDIAKYIYRSDC
ncbi:ABC transporter substrate-binding protein [Kitasatospora sp. NPDC057015]|uniref:ABC transporter substrate-binding protein n=1 Tax=Kitasatospora sp. NPDC057015 TaxID=3346001 RepID=UPI00362507BE